MVKLAVVKTSIPIPASVRSRKPCCINNTSATNTGTDFPAIGPDGTLEKTPVAPVLPPPSSSTPNIRATATSNTVGLVAVLVSGLRSWIPFQGPPAGTRLECTKPKGMALKF